MVLKDPKTAVLSFSGNHLCWSLFLIKLHAFNFIKNPSQVFSCEYYEIFKNTFFYIEHLRWLLLDLTTTPNTWHLVKKLENKLNLQEMVNISEQTSN